MTSSSASEFRQIFGGGLLLLEAILGLVLIACFGGRSLALFDWRGCSCVPLSSLSVSSILGCFGNLLAPEGLFDGRSTCCFCNGTDLLFLTTGSS